MLEARGITKRFGPVLANRRVDLRVAPGEVLALLGENGAGKSTLVHVLAGLVSPDGGSLSLDGRPVSFRSPGEAAAAGVAAVHQHFALVPSLTVEENLWLAVGGDRAGLKDRSRALLDEVGFQVPLAEPASRLPVPLQQRAEILRALLQECRYLLLDEPTAALGPEDAAAVQRLVRSLAARGRGVVVVTHRLGDVTACADRITVLRRGRNAGEWPVAGTDLGAVCEAMVGGLPPVAEGTDLPPVGPSSALSLRGVSCPPTPGLGGLSDVSLDVRAGEIVGIAGVSGNGQEPLAEVAAGLRRPEAGAVFLGETDVTRLSPAGRQRLGLGHVPADRRRHGVAGPLPVYQNLCLRRYREDRLSPAGWVRRSRWRELARSLMATVSAAWPLEAPAANLSGGNLQRLVLAREIDAAARVLVAVYPTRGLDTAATAEVRSLLTRTRRSGGSVLLVSEDLDELLELSDRILVLSGGRIGGTIPRGGATPERLGRLLTGVQGERCAPSAPP